MLRACYKIWLLAATLLRGGKSRTPFASVDPGKDDSSYHSNIHIAHQEHELAHRALIHLMNQKTDAMLAALSETIDKERQKLGVVVRNPAATERFEADGNLGLGGFEAKDAMVHDRILAMSRKGTDVSHISRQLQLPEDEVTMILRLKAA